jgi:hypothetical protein
MQSKRRFLQVGVAAGAVAATSAALSATPARSVAGGPTLLTVTGAVGKVNRGPLDPALDQLMAKQGLRFERAHAFDFGALTRLPAVRIRPTLEYDARPHALRGPLLTEVLRAAGASTAPNTPLALRAIDGYTARLSLGEAVRLRMVVATHLDGRPLGLGGLGPLWAVLDADRLPALAAKPLAERFAQCPWGLFHIGVDEAG